MHYYPLSVIGVSWAFWLWQTYLDYRQYRVYITTTKVPKELEKHIDNETFTKAKAYSIDKARIGFISGLYGQLQSTLVLYYYLMPEFWNFSHRLMTSKLGLTHSNTVEWEIFQSLIFTLMTSLLSTLAGLPISIYNTFVIEERHGFNKQTAGFYAWDKFKMFAVSFIITAPIVSAVVWIVRNCGDYFFLYLWIFCFLVVCVLVFFHGEIAALFDKFTPLPEGELRSKIETLASSINFPLYNIFVVEGSKRSSHSNAYQSGLLNKKRIVIYDTLIEGYYDDKIKKDEVLEGESKKSDPTDSEKKKDRKGCNQEEILSVLCHELGHWYHGHLIKNLAFTQLNLLIIFVIFSAFYKDPSFYAAFGFSEMPVIIGFALLMMVLAPYSELQEFIATLLSRKYEYQSDYFAKTKGRAEHLKTALVKLHKDNLGFPVHDELYSKFNHSHPTLIQRLKALDKVE